MSILVCGEALVDVLPNPDGSSEAIPGGSPFNVAVGLARLGLDVGFLGKLSSDSYGKQLEQHLVSNGVATDYVVHSPLPTTVARVTTPYGSEPEYAFEIEGTADRAMGLRDLPSQLPSAVRAMHFGSYSLALESTASTLARLMEREADRRVISLDPNVRPSLLPSADLYRPRFERWVRRADIVKLSAADFAWIYRESEAEPVIKQWLQDRTVLAVITRGAEGAIAYTRSSTIRVPGQVTDVVDTVGAGDAFMAGLLAGLHDQECLSVGTLHRLDAADIAAALDLATRAAAITCGRSGANPPVREELRSTRGEFRLE